jgi:hypothetical protein
MQLPLSCDDDAHWPAAQPFLASTGGAAKTATAERDDDRRRDTAVKTP